jgi:hypothetical protein
MIPSLAEGDEGESDSLPSDPPHFAQSFSLVVTSPRGSKKPPPPQHQRALTMPQASKVSPPKLTQIPTGKVVGGLHGGGGDDESSSESEEEDDAELTFSNATPTTLAPSMAGEVVRSRTPFESEDDEDSETSSPPRAVAGPFAQRGLGFGGGGAVNASRIRSVAGVEDFDLGFDEADAPEAEGDEAHDFIDEEEDFARQSPPNPLNDSWMQRLQAQQLQPLPSRSPPLAVTVEDREHPAIKTQKLR